MFTVAFWKAAVERAGKTFAQSWVAFAVASGAMGLLDFDWGTSLSVAGLATLLSLASSIGSDAITSSQGPSLTNAETTEGQ